MTEPKADLEMIRVLKISRPKMGSYLEANVGVAQEEIAMQLTESELGDELTFTTVEISREEYDALPEFMGW